MSAAKLPRVYLAEDGHYSVEGSPEIRYPRPGPQLPARRCEHAASGCNYPEGDCAGLCLVVAPRKAA